MPYRLLRNVLIVFIILSVRTIEGKKSDFKLKNHFFIYNNEIVLEIENYEKYEIGIIYEIRNGSGMKIAEGLPGKTIRAGRLPLGWYKISLKYRKTGEISREAFFSVLPKTYRKANASESPFGIHIELDQRGLKGMQYLGIKNLRLHAYDSDILKWKSVEKVKGVFTFNEAPLKIFFENGVNILSELGQTPDWASAKPDAVPYPQKGFFFGAAAHRPVEMKHWANYVSETVKRFNGKISYYEVWNEPDIHFFVSDNKFTDYSELLKTAYTEIKMISAKIKVVAPAAAYFLHPDQVKKIQGIPDEKKAMYRDPSFLPKFLVSDLDKYYDIFSFHHYPTVKGNSVSKSVSMIEMKEKFQPVLSKGKEIWITEFNVTGGDGSYNDAESELRSDILVYESLKMLYCGVSKIFFYNARDQKDPNQYSNIIHKGSPQRVFSAIAFLTLVYDTSHKMSVESSDSADKFTLKFNNYDINVYFCKTDMKFNAEQNITFTDNLGSRISPQSGSYNLKRNHIYYRLGSGVYESLIK